MRSQHTDDPLVSVIICTYNRRRLVRRAIRSVHAQTYSHWQLIIVDDGSTDGTTGDLSEAFGDDPRITILHQSNHGLAHARNTGLRNADGKYLCFLDSDDEYTPRHISMRVARMEKQRSVDMLYGGLRVTGPIRKRYVADLEKPGRLIHVTRCYVGGTFFLRRSVVSGGMRFRELSFGEDLDLVRRVQKRHRVEKVNGMRTYIYHCETADRLCEAYK